MELRDAILQRHSVRGFTSQLIPKQTLREILSVATRAVSGENCQPWEFAVAAGEPLERLKKRNTDLVRANVPMDREDWPLPDAYRPRGRAVGKALLTAMEIAREDRDRRAWWAERGYRFFDAPAVIFLLMDNAFDETAYRFDMGCVAQNICLAAMEYGLGTCVEDQAVSYHKDAREILGIPEDKRFVIGIAIGYPDDSFPANHVRTAREPVDAITRWSGF